VTTVGKAYSESAAGWVCGPGRIYGRLAALLAAFSPFELEGQLVLDLGSGTGAGSEAAVAAGARVLAVDASLGMLLLGRPGRPPAAAGSADRLPLRDGGVDIVLAPFVLNHLTDPARGVREAGRVAPALVASTYASDDDHPVKAAVDEALREAGWFPPAWHAALQVDMAAWGTVAGATDAVCRGGMRPVRVEHVEVPFPELQPEQMVGWRMGLAQCAGFVETLDPPARERLAARALELLGPDPGTVVRRVVFLAATRAPT